VGGRSSDAEAQRTRGRILERAIQHASVEGLSGLTFGRLANELGLSKAGVIGHFTSNEALQLATVEAAEVVFRRTVLEPTEHLEPGFIRLHRLCEAWLAYIVECPFEGGCFFEAAGLEMMGRTGPVRDRVVENYRRWRGLLETEARRAIRDGDLPRRADPRQVAFELRAIIAGLNEELRLGRDPRAAARAKVAARRALGFSSRAH
jgi:AcrR family transcriptional regulator